MQRRMSAEVSRCLLVGILALCAEHPTVADESARHPPEPIFKDATVEVGLDFRHRAGRSADYQFPEIMGAGLALFDYDSDGDLDVYLVQGGSVSPGEQAAEEVVADRLFRNDLTEGENGQPQVEFVDVTAEAGIHATAYGMGVAAADYDNNGDVDLYVTNFGPNQLLRNDGDGTFTDVTAESHSGDPGWGTSGTFFDYDRDGWLDLYVANYVHYRADANRACHGYAGERDYCGPLSFDPQPDRLLHNRGDGTFEDVSSASGILAAFGAGLGVVSADLDGDGGQDLYVANDQTANQLWMNQGDGTFENHALLAGVAVNATGAAEASMGVDAGDVDNDGDDDLVLSHLRTESNTLYLNDGGALFADQTQRAGLATPSIPFTGFGAAWIDFDNDGWLDFLVVNGDVKMLPELVQIADADPYRQSNQLFQNLNGRGFRSVSAWGGSGITEAETSRGAAFGDLDNDGDVDVVVQNNDGSARVLLNQVGNGNQWVGFRLVDPTLNRDALGARVEIVTNTGRVLHRRVHTDGSYASANDPRVLVGLGKETGVKEVRVRWPGGDEERFGGRALGAYHTLLKGSSESPQ